MAENATRWLTPDEFATQARVSTRTVRRWCASGVVPARRIAGHTLRIPAAALDAIGEPLLTGAAS